MKPLKKEGLVNGSKLPPQELRNRREKLIQNKQKEENDKDKSRN